MTKQKFLSKAIFIAAQFHSNQFDRGGVPYLLHCIKVMQYLKSDDEELNCIAILHDIIEDTNINLATLLTHGMTPRIVSGIVALTKSGDLTDKQYLDQIKLNPDAVKVKMSDLCHNSDIRRLKNVRKKDFDRTTKYLTMYEELKNYKSLY